MLVLALLAQCLVNTSIYSKRYAGAKARDRKVWYAYTFFLGGGECTHTYGTRIL